MSQYPRGKEPICPECQTGRIRSRGAVMCAACNRTRSQRGWKPPDTDAPPALADARPSETVKVDGDHCEIAKTTHEKVRTLDALIRVCEIDTQVWEIERWVCNKWEMGSKDPKSGDVTVTPLYQVKVWLKRKVAIIAARDEIRLLLEDAKRMAPRRPSVVRKKAERGHMLEISIPDLHIGKLAWSQETGHDDYDTHIAERIHDEALDALIARTSSHRFEQVLYVVGNDLLHSDTKQGTTTSGTPLDTDTRFHRSFAVARRMVTRAVDRLREVAPVTVLLVPGNHDTLSTWHLGDSLECYYHRCDDVTIDNTPTMRKYHQFGKVMLLFTHGNRGRLDQYPLLMATEQPEMFGATIHREAHTGDKHQLRVQEHKGVRVRISPALCPPDAWHSEHHFVGNARSAEAFVWHREEGLIGTAIYTVLPKPLQRTA